LIVKTSQIYSALNVATRLNVPHFRPTMTLSAQTAPDAGPTTGIQFYSAI
jgi:hypothetical protein